MPDVLVRRFRLITTWRGSNSTFSRATGTQQLLQLRTVTSHPVYWVQARWWTGRLTDDADVESCRQRRVRDVRPVGLRRVKLSYMYLVTYRCAFLSTQQLQQCWWMCEVRVDRTPCLDVMRQISTTRQVCFLLVLFVLRKI